jgi:molybdopterin synthase catalytic subunit
MVSEEPQQPSNTSCTVAVQAEDFDVSSLQSALVGYAAREGAVVAFTGYVRAANEQREVAILELEHYPGMTESSITVIMEEAAERWPLLAASVVHRVGPLAPGDQIVWVGVSSAHREAAFEAAEFIMDYLKTRAPFWKKELGPQGAQWVAERTDDVRRADRWAQPPEQK